MTAKKRKSASKSKIARQTTLSPEGFLEPFNIDDVPWRKVSAASTAFKRLGSYGGGSQVGVGIVCFPSTGKARIRATAKTVPITSL